MGTGREVRASSDSHAWQPAGQARRSRQGRCSREHVHLARLSGPRCWQERPRTGPESSTRARRVLTMDRLHGVPLTDLAAIRAITAARDPEEILIGALNTWFGFCRRLQALPCRRARRWAVPAPLRPWPWVINAAGTRATAGAWSPLSITGAPALLLRLQAACRSHGQLGSCTPSVCMLHSVQRSLVSRAHAAQCAAAFI